MTTKVRREMVEPGFATTVEMDAMRALFIGMEADFPFIPAAPWLPEFGQTLNISDYPVLFAKIGTTYGGNGTTTFALPDKRGRVTAGVDNMGGTSANRLTNQTGGLNGDVLGAAGGAETHALSVAQMPAHKHDVATQSAGAHTHTTDKGPSGSWDGNNSNSRFQVSWDNSTGTVATSSSGAHVHGVTEAEKGSGSAHNNVQPTITAYRCILAS